MTFNELYDFISSGNKQYDLHIVFNHKIDKYFPFDCKFSNGNCNYNVYYDNRHQTVKEILNDIFIHGGKFIIRNNDVAYLCENNKFTEIEILHPDHYTHDLSFNMESFVNSKKLTIDEYHEKYSKHNFGAKIPYNIHLQNNVKKYGDNIVCKVENFTESLKILNYLNMNLKFVSLGNGGYPKYFILSDGIISETYKLSMDTQFEYTQEQVNEFNLMSII